MTEPRPVAAFLPRDRTAAIPDPSEWPLVRCPECGIPRPRPVDDGVPCDACRDDSAETARLEAQRMAAGNAERRKYLPMLLARAGCPKRYQGYTREAWEGTYGPWGRGPITSQIADWTGEELDTWLVLFWGDYGRRKTSLATALLSERIAAGKRALWLDTAAWAQQMQAGIKDGTSMDVYDRAARAEVLLLDDLGSVLGAREGRRAEQTWWSEQCALLLRHRESAIKPTIVTANLSERDANNNLLGVKELARIDASLESRCDVKLAFRLTGPDYRGRDQASASPDRRT